VAAGEHDDDVSLPRIVLRREYEQDRRGDPEEDDGQDE